MNEQRDTELGRRLESIAEPDHAPDYWDRLRLQLGGAAEPRPSVAERLRAALGGRRLRLAVVATAVVAVAAAAVLFGMPRSRGPETVDAATVVKRMLTATSSGRTWQAEVTLKAADWNRSLVGFHYDYLRFRLLQSADGSYRLTQLGRTRHGGSGAPASATPSDVLVYDAATGVLGHYRAGRGLVVTRNVPLGPPDAPADPLTGVDFGSGGRAMQAAGAFTLEDAVVDGRAAWTVTCTKGDIGRPAGSGSTVDWPVYKVTTDKRTWLPLRFQQIEGGVLIADLRYLDVRYNEPLPANAFSLPATEGRPVRHKDAGFRRVTLDEAGSLPGVTPLVPGFVPAGFRLAAAAVADEALTANHLVRTRHVLELQYTHGFDALTVSTRTIADPYYSVHEDPVDAYDPAWTALVRTQAPITSGAFAGETASIVVATTSSTPHLWAVKDGVLLTIAGAATAEELLEVAGSLQTYPAAAASSGLEQGRRPRAAGSRPPDRAATPFTPGPITQPTAAAKKRAGPPVCPGVRRTSPPRGRRGHVWKGLVGEGVRAVHASGRGAGVRRSVGVRDQRRAAQPSAPAATSVTPVASASPAAATEFRGMLPVVCTGRVYDSGDYRSVTTVDGVKRMRHALWKLLQRSSDPRLSGNHIVVINVDQRRADMSAALWGTSVVRNAAGTWTGKWTGAIAAGGDLHYLHLHHEGLRRVRRPRVSRDGDVRGGWGGLHARYRDRVRGAHRDDGRQPGAARPRAGHDASGLDARRRRRDDGPNSLRPPRTLGLGPRAVGPAPEWPAGR